MVLSPPVTSSEPGFRWAVSKSIGQSYRLPSNTSRTAKSIRSFRQLNFNLLIAHLAIGVLVQSLAAYYTGAPIIETLTTVLISGLLVTALCFCRVLRIRRMRWMLFSMTFAVVSAGVYGLNGGLFGTFIDPALLTFGTASFVAVDGTIISLGTSLIGGFAFTIVGGLIFPKYYFGADASQDLVRVGSHMVWWTVLVTSGYILGRCVYRIINDLEKSRLALEAAQQSESALRQRTERERIESDIERNRTFDRLGVAFKSWMQTAVDEVATTSMDVSREASATREMAAAGAQISKLVVDVANQSHLNMQAVAIAASDLSGNMGHSSEQVALATAAMIDAADRVKEGGDALKRLQTKGYEIQRMVGLIGTIAGQTHLLALNASVEAARGGQAATGFTGVAADLNQLAGLTSQATERIGVLVSGMQAALLRMANANAVIERSVMEANSHGLSVSSIMEQQSVATAKVAITVKSVMRGIEKASSQMADAAVHAERTARTAEAMQDCANVIDRDVLALRQEAIRFVSELRTVQ